MFLFRSFGELIDRLVCIVIAILFAQAPLYIEQYVHVLSGALAEAKLSYEDIKLRASMLIPPMTVEEFIAHHLNNEDAVFQTSGQHYQEQVLHYENYTASYEQLSTCSLWAKPFIFLKYKEAHLIEALHYKPGLPFSTEGFAYLLVGACLGLILVSLVRALFRRKPKEEVKS